MHPFTTDTLKVLERIIIVVLFVAMLVSPILRVVMPLCMRSNQVVEGVW
jgi:hypothetical protein